MRVWRIDADANAGADAPTPQIARNDSDIASERRKRIFYGLSLLECVNRSILGRQAGTQFAKIHSYPFERRLQKTAAGTSGFTPATTQPYIAAAIQPWNKTNRICGNVRAARIRKG